MNSTEFIFCPECLKLFNLLKENPGGSSVCKTCMEYMNKMAEGSPLRLMPVRKCDMKIEEQVCSVELGEKLLTLGVKQNAYHSWLKLQDGYHLWLSRETNCATCSAFNVAELGEILPINLNSYKLDTGKWYCEAHECYGAETNWEYTEDETEANARAKMLIYLLENKLLTLEK